MQAKDIGEVLLKAENNTNTYQDLTCRDKHIFNNCFVYHFILQIHWVDSVRK
jgi:hypothetical protein